MGEKPETIFVTGCPSIDLAKKVLKKQNSKFDPFKKYYGVGNKLDINKPFIVVLQHPHTIEFDKTKEHITETILALEEINIPVIWFWPNVDAGSDTLSKQLRALRERNKNGKFYFFKNLESEDFLKLLLRASCLVGNSSVGIRECSFLGIPVVNIGERQKNRLTGKNVISVKNKKSQIKNALLKQIQIARYDSEIIYGDGNSGKKIADIIENFELNINKQFVFNYPKNIIKEKYED